MVVAEQSVIFPSLPDFLWGTVSFIIVAVAIYYLAWPTFMKMLDERGEKIEKGLHAADAAKAEVEAERAKMADERAAATREAAEIRSQAQENAKAIVARAQEQANEEARRISASAQRQIAADAEAAQRVLRDQMGALATNLAGKIVGQQVQLDSTVSQSVVDQFLTDLDEGAVNAHH
ncbi:F0F1 ATP synthase subunit B [Neoactinobaculum massilliense]|uniref:F0F1 ATP synthase subunit B n=1 Tax=Neoactinobaculum massilliense TaxID=2364794 RepID=UPI000F5499C9|nr:F0F1 ATP synthase subunit B [Neoactinobaculum massilliense]